MFNVCVYTVEGISSELRKAMSPVLVKTKTNDSASIASVDSTGKKKSFRRLLTRFAEKTSMVGVPYINAAKFWWAKVIWSFLLLVALGFMCLHLWYTFDQYYSWPKTTKFELGFDTLPFPEVTICNTNVMHKGRLDKFNGAEELKKLLVALQPANLVPDQFDPNYDPTAQDNNPSNQAGQRTTQAPPPGQQTTQAPPPGQQTTQATPPGQQTTQATPPGQQTTQAPLPSLQTTQTPLPGQQTTQAPLPGQQTTQSPLPGQQTTQAPLPGQQTTQAPLPGQQTTQAPQPNQQTTQAPIPGQQTTQAPVPGQQTTQAPVPGQQPSPDNQGGGPPPPSRKKRFVSNYDSFNTSQFDTKKEPKPRDVKPKDEGDYKGEVDQTTAISDLFTELFMDEKNIDRAHLGHNITDMLLSCTFNGLKCTPDMFKLHQTAEYGNCWSLSSDQFNVKTSGSEGGLSLIFYLEVLEYLKGVTNGYGLRIQIHQPDTYPFPAQEGLFIPASMETDIGLRMIRISRLDGNYGKCDNGNTFRSDLNYTYTRRACQQFCKISHVISNCNCFNDASEEFAKGKDENLRPCRSQTEVTCMVNIEAQYEKQQLTCYCENPCNETVYSKSTSQRQWPSDDYALVLLQGVCDRNKEACKNIRKNISDNRATNNNFLKLNIYYEDLNYEYITESPEIEIQQFLSDIGGAIGLWIGLSILSLCEVIQLFVELFDFAIHKTVKGRKQRKKKLNKERQLRVANERTFSNNNKETRWPNTQFNQEY